jgi:hypothetical protein
MELDPEQQETALGRKLAEVLVAANGTGRPEVVKQYLRGYGLEHGEREAEKLRRMLFRGAPDAPAPPLAARREWSHDDLLAAKFPPMKWAVEGLVLGEGLTGLGAKKKLGKSWMCLQLAQGVAAGQPVLGRRTQQGSVIYICLEDGAARLQGRLAAQHAEPGLPITYVTSFRPLDAGGLADLEELIRNTRPSLVIIDTLAAAKTGKIDENEAGAMGDLFNALRDLARAQSVGILMVAHHGKSITGDPGQDFRGSSAIGGALDLSLGIYKADNAVTLKAEGRDIGEQDLRIEFDARTTWSWSVRGDARHMARSEAETEGTNALRRLGRADARSLGRELGKSRVATREMLDRLRLSGVVREEKVKNGRVTRIEYVVADAVEDTDAGE